MLIFCAVSAHSTVVLLFLAPASSTAAIAAVRYISRNVTTKKRLPSPLLNVHSAFTSSTIVYELALVLAAYANVKIWEELVARSWKP